MVNLPLPMVILPRGEIDEVLPTKDEANKQLSVVKFSNNLPIIMRLLGLYFTKLIKLNYNMLLNTAYLQSGERRHISPNQ